jgi:hypothetical protein
LHTITQLLRCPSRKQEDRDRWPDAHLQLAAQKGVLGPQNEAAALSLLLQTQRSASHQAASISAGGQPLASAKNLQPSAQMESQGRQVAAAAAAAPAAPAVGERYFERIQELCETYEQRTSLPALEAAATRAFELAATALLAEGSHRPEPEGQGGHFGGAHPAPLGARGVLPVPVPVSSPGRAPSSSPFPPSAPETLLAR